MRQPSSTAPELVQQGGVHAPVIMSVPLSPLARLVGAVEVSLVAATAIQELVVGSRSRFHGCLPPRRGVNRWSPGWMMRE